MNAHRLSSAWGHFRTSHELVPVGQRTPVDLTAVTEQIAAVLRRWFSPEDVDARFAVPSDAQQWLVEIARQSFRDEASWMWLAAARDVPAATADRWEVLASGPPARRELWIVIGSWSDKHDYMLCCDRTSPRFGAVADWYDTHPWWDEDAEPWELWPDLVTFFERPGDAGEPG